MKIQFARQPVRFSPGGFVFDAWVDGVLRATRSKLRGFQSRTCHSDCTGGTSRRLRTSPYAFRAAGDDGVLNRVLNAARNKSSFFVA